MNNSIHIKSLYAELLKASEMEQQAISSRDLESIEHYCEAKVSLISRIQELCGGKAWHGIEGEPGCNDEIGQLIEKILAIHNENARSLQEFKDDIIHDISAFKINRQAFSAYRSCS